MTNNLSKTLNWVFGAVIVLLLIAMCFRWDFWGDPKPKTVYTKITDTVWHPKDVLKVVKQPVPYKVEVPKYITKYIRPSGNYDSLLKQFDSMASTLYTINNYSDTLKQDSSYVAYDIGVQANAIQSIKTDFHLNCPVIHEKETIKTTEHDGRQLYLGASLGGINKLQGFMIGGSVLYKNRKDNITAVTVSIDNTGNYYYQLSRYFKISFKRR